MLEMLVWDQLDLEQLQVIDILAGCIKVMVLAPFPRHNVVYFLMHVSSKTFHLINIVLGVGGMSMMMQLYFKKHLDLIISLLFYVLVQVVFTRL